MKAIIKRLDAILILTAAVVYKSNADPAETCMIAVCIVFCLGVLIEAIQAAMIYMENRRHAEWRRTIEDSDKRFENILRIMEGMN